MSVKKASSYPMLSPSLPFAEPRHPFHHQNHLRSRHRPRYEPRATTRCSQRVENVSKSPEVFIILDFDRLKSDLIETRN